MFKKRMNYFTLFCSSTVYYTRCSFETRQKTLDNILYEKCVVKFWKSATTQRKRSCISCNMIMKASHDSLDWNPGRERYTRQTFGDHHKKKEKLVWQCSSLLSNGMYSPGGDKLCWEYSDVLSRWSWKLADKTWNKCYLSFSTTNLS